MWKKLHKLMLSKRARPLRFAFTGGISGLIQLLLLSLMTRMGWSPILANAIAFLLAAQVNFLLSLFFTWRDRLSPPHWLRDLLRHWGKFHLSILGTALLNQALFLTCRPFLPTLLAAMLGIILAAFLNFTLIDRFVFRQK